MKSARHKLPIDTAFRHTMLIFMLGILITCSFYNPFLAKSDGVVPSVLGRSYPLQQPDIHVNEGGTIRLEGVTAIIEGGTFAKDVYLRVDRTARGNPIEIDGLWQVSDIWNVRFRFHSNDDEVSTVETQRNYILSFPYVADFLITDQGVRFDEQSLKLIRGETATGPWIVLENSVVDMDNNTVSALINRGGFFMISGGFYKRVQNIGGSEVVGKKESVEDVEDVGNNDEAVKADAKPTLGKIKNNEKKSSSSSKPLSVGEAATKLSGALSDFFSALFGR